jgi:hypothetical protein
MAQEGRNRHGPADQMDRIEAKLRRAGQGRAGQAGQAGWSPELKAERRQGGTFPAVASCHRIQGLPGTGRETEQRGGPLQGRDPGKGMQFVSSHSPEAKLGAAVLVAKLCARRRKGLAAEPIGRVSHAAGPGAAAPKVDVAPGAAVARRGAAGRRREQS